MAEQVKIIGKDGLIDATGVKTLDKMNKEIKDLDYNFSQLANTLKLNEKELKDLAKIQQKAISNTGNDAKKVLELTEASKKLNEEYKRNVKAQQNVIKEQEKLAVAKKKVAQLTLQEKEAAKESLKVDRLVAKSKNQVKGSVEELRTRLSLVTLSWAKLSQEELENSKRGQRLVRSKKQLTDQLKKLEKATGDNRREVGNYSGAINDAANEMGLFGGSLGTAIRILKLAQTNLIAMSSSLGVFRLALISTGIGALVVALGSLITFLTKSQKGIDKMNQVLAVLGQVADEITDVAINMGEAIFDAFSNPKQAIKDLGNAIVDNVINRFKGIALIGDAVVKLFNDFTDTKAWEDLGNAVAQTATGITDVSGKAKSAAQTIGDIVENAKEDSKEALELEKRRQDLEKRRIAFIIREEVLRGKIADARKDAEDSDKTIQQRISANLKAIEFTKQLQKETASIEQERLDIIKTQNTLAESLNEDLEAEAQAEADLLKTSRERDKTMKSLLAKQKALNGELNKSVKSEKEITNETEKQEENLTKINEKQDQQFKDAIENSEALASIKERQKQDAQEEANRIEARKDLEEEVLGTIVDQGTALVKNKQAADIVNATLKALIANFAATGSFGSFKQAGAGASQGAATGGSFAHGGYTGDGGKFEEAGVVHKGEYVIDKETTAALGMKNVDMNTLSRAVETTKVSNQIKQGQSLSVALAPKAAPKPEPIDYERLGAEVGKNIPEYDFTQVGAHYVSTQKKYKEIKRVVHKSTDHIFTPKQIPNNPF